MDDDRLSRALIPPLVLTGLVEVADQHGLDPAGWFVGTGLDRHRIAEPHALVSYRQAITVVRRALAVLPPGPLGLRIGSRDPLLSWGTLGTAVRSAATGAEALRVASQYHQGAGTLLDYDVSGSEAGHVVELIPRSHEPDLLVFLSEEAFAGIVVLLRLVFGPDAHPVSAQLSYPPPPWAGSYSRLWRCPLAFDCDRSTLVVPAGLDERRIPTANATQFALALEATRAMVEPDAVTDLVRAVEGVLREDLRSRRTADQVAAELGISTRTLHRRLSDAGERFGAVQDRVRRQQADLLLRATRRSVAAIAADLGYSDARELRRAYKRWTGLAPTQVRGRPAG